ncbi:MAG: hypothetical protein AAGF94_08145 [Pseudomonadota bacterium]
MIFGALPSQFGGPITVTSEANVPASFSTNGWAISDMATGGDALITIFTLPGSNGSPVQVVQVRIDGGAWTAIPGSSSAGVYTLLDQFTDGVVTNVELRAVNALGPGPTSSAKSVTTTPMAAQNWGFSGSVVTALPEGANWQFSGSAVTAIGDI